MVPPNWAFDTISINANGGGIVNSTDELSSISIISFDLNFCGGSSDILLDTFSVRDSLKLCADSVSVSNLMIVQNPVELVFEASEDVIVSFFEGYVGRYTIESNDILVTNDVSILRNINIITTELILFSCSLIVILLMKMSLL